jgi:hypothetical protein
MGINCRSYSGIAGSDNSGYSQYPYHLAFCGLDCGLDFISGQ